MSPLERQQIIDKNGRLTTRWVRNLPLYSRSPHADIPAPQKAELPAASLPRGAVKEMKEIKTRLVARLNDDFKNEARKHPWGSVANQEDCLVEINKAFTGRDYEKLRVYDKYMNVNMKSEHLSSFVSHLQEQGHQQISEGLSDEIMEGFNKLSNKLRRYTLGGFPDTIKNLEPEERDALANHAGELMYKNPGAEEKLYILVVDHGVLEHDRLTAALEESDRIETPFVGGIL